MNYKICLIFLLYLRFSYCENFWINLALYMKQNKRARFAATRIFIFDRGRKDFVSLLNESQSNMMHYTELENRTIRVVVPQMPPYVVTFNETDEISGFVGDIWNVFQECLKFKTNLLTASFDDGVFMLLDSTADVMLTAGIATTGFPMLEYSQPYFYNWYQLYMRIPSRTPNSTFYVRTLTPTFWYSCIAIFLLLTATLRITVRVLNRVGQKYHNKCLEEPIPLATCFLTIIAGFFNQGFDVHVRSYSARTQVMIALIFGYTVYTGMSALLVSELAVSELQMPVKSLEDVVDKGEWSLCVRNDSFVYELLVDNPVYTKVLNGETCKKNNVVEPNTVVCNSDTVMLENQAVMTSHLKRNNIKCEILTIHGRYFRRGNSIMVNKEFKYRKIIYTYMEKLRGNGILHKLQHQWVRPMKMEEINPPATIEVTLYHVKGILVLYSATALFSFVVLVLECVVNKCTSRRTNWEYIQ